MELAAVFAGGKQMSKLLRQGREELEAVVHTTGGVMNTTIHTLGDEARSCIVEYEQSTGRLVKLMFSEARDSFEVIQGRVEETAQLILRKGHQEAYSFLQKGVASVQQILHVDVPLAARLVGLEVAQGVADGFQICAGRAPTQSLLGSVHRSLLNPDATPSQVMELINRQGHSVPSSEILSAYKRVLTFFAQSERSSEEAFLYQLWFYAAARLKLPAQLSWMQWALSPLFTPDAWKPLSDTLVTINDAALRLRALICVEKIPATFDEERRTVLLELAEIAYELRGQPALAQPEPPQEPRVTAEMKGRLMSSLKNGQVQDARMVVREMMEIDPESVIQAIQEDREITLSKFLAFYQACGNCDERKQVLRAFAKRIQPRVDRESTQEVMDLAGHWRNAFPSELLPFDFSNVTVASCNKSLEQEQFLRAADILLLYIALQDNTGSAVVNQLCFGGKKIQQTPEVFRLVYALKQRGAHGRLLECFNSPVVALLDSSNSNRQFCIACQNYVLDGRGCEWSGGPGWYVDSKICAEHEKTGSRLWRIKVHEEGKWFSFVTVQDRVLEGGRDAWNNGPSYYATTHPNPRDRTYPNMLWKLTPTQNGRFQIHCQYQNQRLNAEGRSWGYNKLRATTEKGGRGREEDKEFSFVFC